jgi:hypothetical protein
VTVAIDAPADAKWSLYYTTEPDAMSGGTPVDNATDLGIDVLTVPWKVAELPAGNYYLYALLRIDVNNYGFAGPGKIAVSVPTISLAPAWKQGKTGFVQVPSLTIPYTVAGMVGGQTYQVRVEYKRGVNGTWTESTSTAGLTGFTFSSAFDEGDDYYFRASLLQGGNVKATDETSDLIAIANSDYATPAECSGCHPDNGTLEKNLNVLDRITNAGNPMPPVSQGGLLGPTDQLRVRLWFWLTYRD